jgi:hypothetical protein
LPNRGLFAPIDKVKLVENPPNLALTISSREYYFRPININDQTFDIVNTSFIVNNATKKTSSSEATALSSTTTTKTLLSKPLNQQISKKCIVNENNRSKLVKKEKEVQKPKMFASKLSSLFGGGSKSSLNSTNIATTYSNDQNKPSNADGTIPQSKLSKLNSKLISNKSDTNNNLNINNPSIDQNQVLRSSALNNINLNSNQDQHASSNTGKINLTVFELREEN